METLVSDPELLVEETTINIIFITILTKVNINYYTAGEVFITGGVFMVSVCVSGVRGNN